MKEKKQYKALIFDLDGTLIDSLPYHFLAFKELLLERNVRIHDQVLKKLMGMPTNSILKELKKHYRFRDNIEDLREERRFHYFKFLGTKNVVFPGVMKTLKELRLNYKIAIATGSSYVMYTHSTNKDFQSLFDFVSTINDVKQGKPNPDQFLLASRKLRVKPKDCVIIGDSTYDAEAAKKAGMDFIGATTGYNKNHTLLLHGALKTVHSISELKKIL